MSETSYSPRPCPSGGHQAVPAPSPARIDAGGRAPLLMLFVSAAVWLLISSVRGMSANLKFHSPDLVGDGRWFPYGRVHPAASNAFIYGFAMQAGLGVLLWLVCHLGRARLAAPVFVGAGGAFWNVGVTLGVLGILAGD